MSKFRSEDIRRMRQEEEGRSKKRIPDQEKLKETRRRERDYKDILREMSWQEVRDALGLRPGTKEYDTHYQLWRAYRSDRADAERRRRGRQRP